VNVPFLNLAALHASIRSELDEAIGRVIETSGFVGGPEVAAFESELAAAHGVTYGIGCASGTDAISLVLRALDVGPGDEVIVPAMTFFASAEAVTHAGAVPVIADVDPTTLLLTPDGVDAVRTSRTRAVLPVHLYGHVVDFDHLRTWREQGLIVVEDAAQAHLASWGGETIGSIGHAACLSFFPGKNLGAMGDAGAVLTNDDHVASRVRKLRDHGRTGKYVHDEFGVSSRLDAVQAAILRVKLRHLEEWTGARRTIADRYAKQLPDLIVPWQEGAVHHLLVVRVDSHRRTSTQDELARREIGTGVHYPVALSQQPPFEGTPACPVAEAAAAEVLSLPLDPLLDLASVDFVCSALLDALD
jgi:dTDP-4-amino-4,6-dideoxygalactose transaminase